jgi:hypothetical protein
VTHVRNTGGQFTVTETETRTAQLNGYYEDDVTLETDALHRRGLSELGKLLRLCHDINPNGGQLGSGQGICGCGNEF